MPKGLKIKGSFWGSTFETSLFCGNSGGAGGDQPAGLSTLDDLLCGCTADHDPAGRAPTAPPDDFEDEGDVAGGGGVRVHELDDNDDKRGAGDGGGVILLAHDDFDDDGAVDERVTQVVQGAPTADSDGDAAAARGGVAIDEEEDVRVITLDGGEGITARSAVKRKLAGGAAQHDASPHASPPSTPRRRGRGDGTAASGPAESKPNEGDEAFCL